MQQLPEGSARARVVRAFQDGDYGFIHTEYNFFGPKIGFDIFRFEDDLIVEHWDNLQEIATTTASGRTQIDGPTEVTDLDKTQAYKELVKGFVADVLMGGNPGTITNYISPEKYLQHNPAVADGLAALVTEYIAPANAHITPTYPVKSANKTIMIALLAHQKKNEAPYTCPAAPPILKFFS